jgi:pimeloyl-ACP methyl ester carboxylesterase
MKTSHYAVKENTSWKGLIFLSLLICLDSSFLSSPRAGKGSPQEQAGIPEISTPGNEYMVDVGGRKLHCFTFGDGTPAVVLVSGFGTSQDNWNPVIPVLAAQTTVVTFDRAGIGKSEIGDLPAHGEQSARDLHVLLGKLNVPGPCILVGHSYGGSVARLFASMYPDDVAGLILEETQHEDNFSEMKKILKGKDRETFEQVFADALITPENPRTEGDYRSVTREQLKRSRPLPRLPFVVLTCRDRANAMKPMFSDGAIAEMNKLDVALMSMLAALVPGGKQIMIEGTGHYVHVDRPDALLAPLVEMIKEVREKRKK